MFVWADDFTKGRKRGVLTLCVWVGFFQTLTGMNLFINLLELFVFHLSWSLTLKCMFKNHFHVLSCWQIYLQCKQHSQIQLVSFAAPTHKDHWRADLIFKKRQHKEKETTKIQTDKAKIINKPVISFLLPHVMSPDKCACVEARLWELRFFHN